MPTQRVKAEDSPAGAPGRAPIEASGGTTSARFPHLALAFAILLGMVLLRVLVLREMRLDPGVEENHYFARGLVEGYFGLVIQALLPWALGLFIATRGGAARRALLAIPLALWIAIYASGRPFSKLEDTLGFEGSAASRGWLVVGLVSIFFAALLAGMPSWAKRLPRGGFRGTGSLERALGLSVVLAIVLLPRIYLGFIPSPGNTFLRKRIVAELLFVDPPFEVVESGSEEPPTLGTLTPTAHNARDGADLYSLVLPPPASVLVRMPADAGEASLHVRAGFDHMDWQRARNRGEPLALEFEILRDGQRVEHHVEEYDFDADPPGSAWWTLGGDGGIPVEPGEILEFRTGFPEGIQPPNQPLRAGFGGMTLERYDRVAREPRDPAHPNVVFVVMDTLRADRLSTYGYGRPTSPELDRLAEAGTLFSAAHSTSSWTWPSTASLLTGLEPIEHGVQGPKTSTLDHRLLTLAEAFQQLGYTTGAWANNPLVAPSRNFDQGFEHFVPATGFRRAYDMLEEPLAWLDVHRDDRFFLYLHLIDPHSPLLPSDSARSELASGVPEDFDVRKLQGLQFPLLSNGGFLEDGTPSLEKMISEEDQRNIHELYDACVRTGDEALGRILDRLDALGIAEGTVVVFTSDHGEEIFEHGLATHGQGVHQELVRVPLVVAGPGVPKGRRIDTPVSNRWVGPAVLDLLGIEGFPGALPAGADLFATGELVLSDRIVASTQRGWWNGQYPLEVIGIREGPWMLHHAPKGRAWGGARNGALDSVKLFHLEQDPLELVDRAAGETERIREMIVAYRRSAREQEQRAVGRTVSGGAHTEAMLERLGYSEAGEDPDSPPKTEPPR